MIISQPFQKQNAFGKIPAQFLQMTDNYIWVKCKSKSYSAFYNLDLFLHIAILNSWMNQARCLVNSMCEVSKVLRRLSVKIYTFGWKYQQISFRSSLIKMQAKINFTWFVTVPPQKALLYSLQTLHYSRVPIFPILQKSMLNCMHMHYAAYHMRKLQTSRLENVFALMSLLKNSFLLCVANLWQKRCTLWFNMSTWFPRESSSTEFICYCSP